MFRAAAAAVIASFLTSSFAAADEATPDAWSVQIASAVGCGQGGLSRADYRAAADRFVAAQIVYNRLVAAPRLVSSDPQAALAAARRLAEMNGMARAYARDAEKNLFSVIDPNGSGHVSRDAVLRRLTALAGRADLDGDQLLDRWEQKLAEAALAGGLDISDRSTRDKLAAWLALSE